MTQPPKILDGKKLSQVVSRSLSQRITGMASKVGRAPGLAVILVGDDPASRTYVAAKQRFAARCGIVTFDLSLPATCSASELAARIRDLNASPEVDGILLQLPLPKPLDGAAFTRLIAPEKDADGLHPLNQGLLMQGVPAPRSCTPLGVMTLIDVAMCGIEIDDTTSLASIPRASLAGKKAIVIGRSQLVGKPVGLMLLERNATVTYAHSKTADLASECRTADIVVAAAGVPELVRGDWIKPGAIVIDVGINRLADGALTGDVEYSKAASVASAITRVPGGVGPMTVAMLMSNVVDNYARANGMNV